MPTTRYVPDTFEQECIRLLFQWLSEHGFQNPDLPPIYYSLETPPVFEKISHDWQQFFTDDILWEALNSDNNSTIETLTDSQKSLIKELNDNVLPRGNQERKILVGRIVSIDTLLGRYYADTPHIVLYAQGITAYAKRLNVPTAILRAVVLVHEIGHWISHAVPDSRGETWETADFTNESAALCEMWAQLFTYWVAEENGDFKIAFEALNNHQADEYHTYNHVTHHDKTTMLYVLTYWHRCFPHLLNPPPPAEEVINQLIPETPLRIARNIYEDCFNKDILKRKLIESAPTKERITTIFDMW